MHDPSASLDTIEVGTSNVNKLCLVLVSHNHNRQIEWKVQRRAVKGNRQLDEDNSVREESGKHWFL